MRVDDILQKLDHVRRQGDGWVARCPAHEDRNPSLQINDNDGSIGLFCHRGCEFEEICEALEIEPRDAFSNRPRRERTLEKTYDYVDADGNLLYQVLRYDPKGFSQRQPDGFGGWVNSLPEHTRVLYRLPELLEGIRMGRRIFVVEGEKDADAIFAAGGVATTNAGGAQSWQPEFSTDLAGSSMVVIVADRDGPGIKRAHQIEKSLREQTEIRHIELVQAKEGKDASDHLDAGCTLKEFEPLDPEKKTDGIILERFSTIKADPPEWVSGLEGFVPFRAITLLAGEQGCNKSTFACYLAMRISMPPYNGDVMYITTEGDPGVEIKPRLLAVGANVEKCHFVRRATDGFEGIVSFPEDIRELEAEVKRTGTRLIVIDPIMAHVDVADSNNDNSIRTALAPLQQLAQRQNLIVLLIAHINKTDSYDPFKRVTGSKGLTAVARSNLMMGKVTDGHEYRAIASFKSSWADPTYSLQYKVDQVLVPETGVDSIALREHIHSYVKASSLLGPGRSEL